MHVKRFSEFSEEEKPLEGNKVGIESILNKEILIIKHRITPSRFINSGSNQCLTLQFEEDGVTCVLFTGSQVLINQLIKYSNQLPFITTIIKIDRYYTLS